MKLQTISKATASSFDGTDGIITATFCDHKSFYTAVDGGAIRQFPFSSDDLGSTSDDAYVMKGSHITCADSTNDPNSPNTFIIGCSDGQFHLLSPNWRIEKSVQAHNGGVICVRVNPDGLSIASAGEDGLVKIWSRNGMLRSQLASTGTAVTSLNWDCTGKYIMYTHSGMVTVRSASFKQDQTQFRAHRRLITCSAWNPASNEIITGGEDRVARIFDTDGRLLAETAPLDYAVSAVAFLPVAKLCLIGTSNRLLLTDSRLRILATEDLPSGSSICASPTQPRALVAGNGTASLISVTGKKIVYRDFEVVQDAPRKLTVFDLRNGLSESLSFTECVVNFTMNFNNLVVTTQSKIHVYKCTTWSSPVLVDSKEPVRVICQSATMFAIVTNSGVQIIGYDGRPISRINDTHVKWDLISEELIACSPSLFVAVNPDGRRHVFAFSVSTGQMITNEPLQHSAEIRTIRTNQATLQNKARFGFVNTNGDLTICRLVVPNQRQAPQFDAQKLTNFVDEFEWHSTHDVIATRSGQKLILWCCPSAIFSTPELLPMLKSEPRLLFDIDRLVQFGFDGVHVFCTAKDGSNCVVQVDPFLIMLHEAIEVHRNWNQVLQICRAQKEKSLWAVCATSAIMGNEIDAAQEAYAALSIVDRVMFLAKVKRMKSPSARNAMIAVLQGRINEAEDLLVTGGCTFRAVKMNISLGRWQRALDLAKRNNKFVEVVCAYRTRFLEDMKMEETDPQFLKLGPVAMDSVMSTIKQEKAAELN